MAAGGGDRLASGRMGSASWGPLEVSQEKWDSIFETQPKGRPPRPHWHLSGKRRYPCNADPCSSTDPLCGKPRKRGMVIVTEPDK